MKPIFVLSAAAVLTACQPAAKPADKADADVAGGTVDAAADEQAIRAQIDRWGALIKARDAASIAGLYTEDGALMPPNTPISTGRSAVETTWAALMKAPGFDLQIMPEKITVAGAGDMALDRGTYRLTVAPDGKAQTDTGKYVVVWKKVGDEWKAAADIFNSDLPAG